jgi:hypothetical protein
MNTDSSELDEYIAGELGMFLEANGVKMVETAELSKTTDKIKAQILSRYRSTDSDKTVTRFEVIDHTKDGEGRVLTKYGVNVELNYQDEGRTLKVFLTDIKTGDKV